MRKFTRRLTCGWGIVLTLILMCLAVGCSKSPEQDQPQASEKTLHVGIENLPKTLDPRFATDAYGMRITGHLIFNTLVELGYDLQIVPSLAERWEMPDDRTYIFHLKKSVMFHDGRPLTAEDVKFTFEHLMDPATQSPFAGTYNGKISRIEAVDPHTVKFVTEEPIASFLTSVIIPILPKHVITAGKEFPEKLIGSGPFKFVSQSPNEIVLKANDDYSEGRPKCDRVIFKVVKDENTRFLKMKKEELDLLVNAISNDKIAAFKEDPLNKTYTVIEEPGISYNYLAFNMSDPLLQDLRVRQAIAHGIDVDEIIQFKLGGHAVRATGLLSPVNWFHDKETPLFSHDPEKSMALLDAAGYPDPDGSGPRERLTLEMKTSNDALVTDIARVIQSQLSEIGIRLDLKSYEWGTFYGDIKSGNFQLTTMRWVGVTEPDFYYDIFHSSQIPPDGRNRGRYANATVNELAQQGRVTLNADARKKIYAQLQQLVGQDLPYISLWHINNVSIVHKRVQGYRQHPMAGFFSFKDIELNTT